jgi:hypothetical protein
MHWRTTAPRAAPEAGRAKHTHPFPVHAPDRNRLQSRFPSGLPQKQGPCQVVKTAILERYQSINKALMQFKHGRRERFGS